MTPREAVLAKLDGLEQQFPVISRVVMADIMLAGISLVLEQPSQKILLDLRVIAKGGSLERPDVQGTV
jgi:hypothetical protein